MLLAQEVVAVRHQIQVEQLELYLRLGQLLPPVEPVESPQEQPLPGHYLT
jgi:hypothetical protein